MVTMKDIAKKAGVSRQAVSHIMNNKSGAYVSDHTREKVLKIARELNYHTNYFARTLKTGRTNIIGIQAGHGMFFGSTQPYLANVYNGIGSFFDNTEYKFIFQNFIKMYRDDKLVGMFQSRLVDGFIFVLNAGMIKDFIQNQLPLMQKIGVPFVAVHSFQEDLGCHNVGLDCYHGGYSATEHLIGHRYARIGLVEVRSDHHNDLACLVKGHRAALKAHGLPENKKDVFTSPGFGTAAGYEVAGSILASPDGLPEAFLVADDSIAYGMLKRFSQEGVKVPDDIALMGYGDNIDPFYMVDGLSSIIQPGFQKGETAAAMLKNQLDRIHGDAGQPAAGRFVCLKPGLKIRTSCGCSPADQEEGQRPRSDRRGIDQPTR